MRGYQSVDSATTGSILGSGWTGRGTRSWADGRAVTRCSGRSSVSGEQDMVMDCHKGQAFTVASVSHEARLETPRCKEQDDHETEGSERDPAPQCKASRFELEMDAMNSRVDDAAQEVAVHADGR